MKEVKMRRFFRQILCSFLLFAGLGLSVPGYALVDFHVTDTAGTAISSATVTFTDEADSKIFYRTTTGSDGMGAIDLMVTAVGANTPKVFSLGQNFPNPFNPTTMIAYNLPTAADVKLEVYNVLGAKIATLVDLKQTAGSYKVNWNAMDDFGRPVSAGIYFYRIEAGNYSKTMKLLLVK